MFTTKHVMIAVAIAALSLAGIAFLLKEHFTPFMNTVIDSAQKKVLNLVDQEQLKIETARDNLANLETYQTELMVTKSRLENDIQKSGRQLNKINRQIAESKSSLKIIRDRVDAGMPVILKTGDHLKTSEIRLRMRNTNRKLEYAGEKKLILEQLHHQRKQKLESVNETLEILPYEIAALRDSIELLRDKTTLFQMADVAYGKEDADEDMQASLRFAREQLEDAHASIDAKLLSAKQLVGRADVPLKIFDENDRTTEKLVREIDQIINGSQDEFVDFQ